MEAWLERLKNRLSKIDRDDALKWSFIVGGGLLTFVGSIFDQRKKDRLYSEQLPKEVERQAKRIMNSLQKEEKNA